MELILKWEYAKNMLPKKNKFLLIQTKNCKYPATTGYYNGIDFICCDDKTKILNVDLWAYLNL